MGLGALAEGVGQILSRTVFLQTNTATGVPIPLAILDVVNEEVPEYSAEVTDYPVEDGPEITDHIQLKNPTLRLRGKISSTPFDMSVAVANIAAGGLAAYSSAQARSNLLNSGLSEGVGVVGAALQGNASNLAAQGISGAVDAISRVILLNAYQSRTPFSVVTKRFTYKNMVIQRMSFPRNSETGSVLEFIIDLKQVTIVSPTTKTKAQLAEDILNGGTPSTSLGTQSTSAVSTPINQAVQSSPLSNAPGVSDKFPGFFSAA